MRVSSLLLCPRRRHLKCLEMFWLSQRVWGEGLCYWYRLAASVLQCRGASRAAKRDKLQGLWCRGGETLLLGMCERGLSSCAAGCACPTWLQGFELTGRANPFMRQWGMEGPGAHCPWTDMGLHFGTSLTSQVTVGKPLSHLTL